MIKLEVDVARIYEDFAPSYLRHKLISRQGQKSKSKSICKYLPIWQVSYFWNIHFWQFLEYIFKKEYVSCLFQNVNFYDIKVLEFLYIYRKLLYYLKFFEWQNRNKQGREGDTADLKPVWTQHNIPQTQTFPRLSCLSSSGCALRKVSLQMQTHGHTALRAEITAMGGGKDVSVLV